MFIQLLHKKSCIDAFEDGAWPSFSMSEYQKVNAFKKDSVNTFFCQLYWFSFPALISVFSGNNCVLKVCTNILNLIFAWGTQSLSVARYYYLLSKHKVLFKPP